MSTEAKKEAPGKPLAYAELTAKPNADLFAIAKEAVRLETRIRESKDAFTGALHLQAKTVAALKARHAKARDAREISPSKSFREWFAENCGGELPGRVEALAHVFNECVETGALDEAAFDAAAVDWLEKLSAILGAAKKTHPQNYLGAEPVTAALAALGRPGDAGKTLKEIRAAQKNAAKDAAPAKGAKAAAERPLNLNEIGDLTSTLAACAASIRAWTDPKTVPHIHGQVRLLLDLMHANPLFTPEHITPRRETPEGTVVDVETRVTKTGIVLQLPAPKPAGPTPAELTAWTLTTLNPHLRLNSVDEMSEAEARDEAWHRELRDYVRAVGEWPIDPARFDAYMQGEGEFAPAAPAVAAA